MDLLQHNYDKLKDVSIQNGMSLFGVANLEGLESEYKMSPESIYKGLNYGISMGYHLSDRVLDKIAPCVRTSYLGQPVPQIFVVLITVR